MLLYEWQNRDFRFRLTESCRALLLEARPKKDPFDPETGMPAEQVASLLKRLVNLDTESGKGAVPKGWSVPRAFYLPKQVRRGAPFHNMPRDDPQYKDDLAGFARWDARWPHCIVGFLSTDALCVVIPKCNVTPPTLDPIPFDADWLRNALVGRDGKTFLHKPLIEQPWPRSK